jgi:hypothetical protein
VFRKRVCLLSITAAIVASPSCAQIGAPSTTDCMTRWNAQGNAESQAAVAVAHFPRATIFGWSGEGGDYCAATFFTRRGEPWASFALWLDAPNPHPRFGADITGLRYGMGELGAEEPVAANAVVRSDGTLSGL